jgi:hypothetical protein
MAKNIKHLAAELGATIAGRIPEYSPGTFGVMLLARELRERLEPGRGKRPGRPSNPTWEKRPKVPMSSETERRLTELARILSDEQRHVSPMQVAAQILEDATASYFAGTTAKKGGRSGAERP